MSTVSPDGKVAPASAPAASSASSIAVLPFAAAKKRGVTLYSLAAFGLAPASIRAIVVVRSSQWAGPMQGRSAVSLWHVHIGPVSQQCRDGAGISHLACIREL